MKLQKILPILILALAALFRLNNLNWDAGFHLHPDERFLTMTGLAGKIPDFFVYGTLPLMINKFFAQIFGNLDYNAFTLQGRFLSGAADLLVVVLIYKALELLKGPKLWGAFFYAVAVLPIQLSHFFAVDTFLNLFIFASFYLVLRKNIMAAGIVFGLALASKVTAVLILPLIFFLLYPKWRSIALFTGVAFLVLAVADPHVLQPSFIQSLKTLQALDSPSVWYPPGVQWHGKIPIIFSLSNLALWGVGLPYFLFIILGLIYLLKSKNYKLKIIAAWVGLFFLYQSMKFSQPMRYFLPIYPFLAMFAAYGAAHLLSLRPNFSSKWVPPLISGPPSSHKNWSLRLVPILMVLALLVWPVAFSSIYIRPHSRVAASEWIYKNIKADSLILAEHWDDALPLPMEGRIYQIEQLPVFDPDDSVKWEKMNDLLTSGDYYILSSNRAWQSVLNTPEKYPVMSRFYRDLLDGKTNFKKIAEFRSYPRLEIGSWRWEIGDDGADESFTVYDHPKVLIFKKI